MSGGGTVASALCNSAASEQFRLATCDARGCWRHLLRKSLTRGACEGGCARADEASLRKASWRCGGRTQRRGGGGAVPAESERRTEGPAALAAEAGPPTSGRRSGSLKTTRSIAARARLAAVDGACRHLHAFPGRAYSPATSSASACEQQAVPVRSAVLTSEYRFEARALCCASPPARPSAVHVCNP